MVVIRIGLISQILGFYGYSNVVWVSHTHIKNDRTYRFKGAMDKYFTSFIPADSVQSNQCLLNAGSGQLYAFNLNYGSRIFQQTKIDIGDRIPDTLELFLDEDEKGASKLLLIGVGAGDNASGTTR